MSDQRNEKAVPSSQAKAHFYLVDDDPDDDPVEEPTRGMTDEEIRSVLGRPMTGEEERAS